MRLPVFLFSMVTVCFLFSGDLVAQQIVCATPRYDVNWRLYDPDEQYPMPAGEMLRARKNYYFAPRLSEIGGDYFLVAYGHPRYYAKYAVQNNNYPYNWVYLFACRRDRPDGGNFRFDLPRRGP